MILASRLVVVGFCLTLLLLTSSVGRLRFPSSEGQAGRVADASLFNVVVGGWLPTLDEVDMPPLVGQDLLMLFRKRSLLPVALVGGVGGSLRAFLLFGLTVLP